MSMAPSSAAKCWNATSRSRRRGYTKATKRITKSTTLFVSFVPAWCSLCNPFFLSALSTFHKSHNQTRHLFGMFGIHEMAGLIDDVQLRLRHDLADQLHHVHAEKIGRGRIVESPDDDGRRLQPSG